MPGVSMNTTVSVPDTGGNYYSPLLEHNGQIVTGEGFVIDDFTTRAMNYIEEHKEESFFVYLPLLHPSLSDAGSGIAGGTKFESHDLPLRARKDQQENLPHARAALAMCENIDWNVGRLMKKLGDLEIADNTIVIYFSDNGPNGYRWNGRYERQKRHRRRRRRAFPLLHSLARKNQSRVAKQMPFPEVSI